MKKKRLTLLKKKIRKKLQQKILNRKLGIVSLKDLKKQSVQREQVVEKMLGKPSFVIRGLRFTPRMRFFFLNYKKPDAKENLNQKISSRLTAMRKLKISIFIPRNVRRNSFFFRIIRRALKKKSIMRRSSRLKSIFSRKVKIDKKFLKKIRIALINTKKYLYRKQFPKIRGKKNRNFNFMYYNNMEKSSIKFNIGRIVITYLHNNTFMNIHNSKKMLKVFSAGKLGFKGPKRSTPYSRQVVVRKVVKYLLKSKLNILDIYLNSNYNRWYYFMFKEFSKPNVKTYAIRYLVANNSRSHGFMRGKKQRRK